MTIIFALLLEALEEMRFFGNEGLRDDLVAQLVEQYTFNVWALGSSPSGITKKSLNKKFRLFYFEPRDEKFIPQ
jgi:hypothetical protein